METYQQTVDWLFQQLPMYQKVGEKAYKIDLSNIQLLAQHLQHPEKKFKSIHVAGTNGKGSVSHMLASIFQESGYKVGLYTSPHLKDFRERIRINGKEIGENSVIEFVNSNKNFFEKERLSFFEMTVGLAFQYFAEKEVDIAIIEVGLGGRLDSTNIITPEISVITNIGYDHTQFLGEKLADIAAEKGGIIKENIPVIIGEYHDETMPVFKRIAKDKNAPLFLAEKDRVELPFSDLKGFYQKKNINTVLTTVEVLNSSGNWKISSEAVERGLETVTKNTGLRGRWEILQNTPKVICDTAHNKEGLMYVVDQLQQENFGVLHMVIGMVKEKDLDTILPVFPKNVRYYFCKPAIDRGLDAEILKQKAAVFGLKGRVFNSVSEAYKAALHQANLEDVIYIGGSTFVVAEIL